MKNLLLLCILLLFCLVQVSCAQSPKEKLVGMWEEQTSYDYSELIPQTQILTFEDDGTGIIWKHVFKWKIINEKPLTIELDIDGKVKQVSILFVSDNQIELEGYYGAEKKLFSRVDIQTEKTPTDEIELSTFENATRSFFNALKNENIELAKRFYITKEEARQTGFEKELTKKLNRSIKKMEKRYIPDAKGGIWLRFKIDKEESREGIQGVGGHILFISRDNIVRQLWIGIVKLKDGTWKIINTFG